MTHDHARNNFIHYCDKCSVILLLNKCKFYFHSRGKKPPHGLEILCLEMSLYKLICSLNIFK